MGNVTPEMMQTAMSQMGSMSTSEWDQMANKMNTIDPNTIADMSGNIESHFQAQQNYLHKVGGYDGSIRLEFAHGLFQKISLQLLGLPIFTFMTTSCCLF